MLLYTSGTLHSFFAACFFIFYFILHSAKLPFTSLVVDSEYENTTVLKDTRNEAKLEISLSS